MTFAARVQQLGYTRDNGSGCGSGTWPRWGLVPTRPDGAPALLWRDGKPRHVGPRTSGRSAPLWLRRCEAFLGRIGPLPIHALADVATWYREHRVGEYPLDRIDLL